MLVRKDPDATLDLAFDWSPWMAPGDTISTHQITVEGVTLGAHTHDQRHIVTAWVSGGVAGTLGRVTCRVTTAQGRIDDRSIVLDVRQR